jgi:hypothetical protein
LVAVVGIGALFGLCEKDVADWREQATVVVPVDPRQGGVLDRDDRAPRPASVDDLHLERIVDRPRRDVFVAVGAADLRLEACLGVRQHVDVRLPGSRRLQEAAVVAKPQASWKRSSAAGRR